MNCDTTSFSEVAVGVPCVKPVPTGLYTVRCKLDRYATTLTVQPRRHWSGSPRCRGSALACMFRIATRQGRSPAKSPRVNCNRVHHSARSRSLSRPRDSKTGRTKSRARRSWTNQWEVSRRMTRLKRVNCCPDAVVGSPNQYQSQRLGLQSRSRRILYLVSTSRSRSALERTLCGISEIRRARLLSSVQRTSSIPIAIRVELIPGLEVHRLLAHMLGTSSGWLDGGPQGGECQRRQQS